MASKLKQVDFHLMKDVASKKPKQSVRIGLSGRESWREVSGALFATTSLLFLFDPKSQEPLKYDPSHLRDAYYVTKRGYLTPNGKPSKYAYIYQPNGPDIKVGDIVSVRGEEGKFRVEAGSGGNCRNPQLKLSYEKDGKRLSFGGRQASDLTLVQRDIPESKCHTENEPLLSDFSSLSLNGSKEANESMAMSFIKSVLEEGSPFPHVLSR